MLIVIPLAIKNDVFFGIAKVDLEAPEETIKRWEHLDFPFIFRSTLVKAEMLSEKMLSLATEQRRKFPCQALCLTWNAENFLGITPLLKFYLEIGITISKIHYAVNYTRGRPFNKFIEEMVAIRVAAEKPPVNKPLGQRAKFTLNSMAGRFG